MGFFNHDYPYTDNHELNLDWIIKQIKVNTSEWKTFEEALTNSWEEYKAGLNEEWATVEQAWITMKNFVETFFENLDVQEEVNNKIDAMVASGQFESFISAAFGTRFNVIEARMNTFTHLTEGSTTGDAELIDIRVSGNGRTYSTAGDSVRGQYTDVSNNIKVVYNDFTHYVELVRGLYNNGSEDISPSQNSLTTQMVTLSEANELATIFNALDVDIKVRFYLFNAENLCYDSTSFSTIGAYQTGEKLSYHGIGKIALNIYKTSNNNFSDAEVTALKNNAVIYDNTIRTRVLTNINSEIVSTMSERLKDCEDYAKENRETINEIIEDSVYPAYYDTQINNAINEIHSNMDDCGKNGESFIFITDPHWSANTKHSPALIKKIINNSEVSTVICGGDVGGSGTLEDEKNVGRSFMNAFRYLKRPLKFIFGNHDSNKEGHSTEPSLWIPDSGVYSIYQERAEYETVYGNYFYYYFDNPANKTRFICLDTGTGGDVSNAQMQWLTNLLNNSTSMKIIIVMHIIYISNTEISDSARAVFNLLDTYNNVKAIFGGHSHIDKTSRTTGGIPIILTDCDSYNIGNPDNPNTATIGTITEQCFDVVTINYNANTIKCVRVGRGSDRIITI